MISTCSNCQSEVEVPDKYAQPFFKCPACNKHFKLLPTGQGKSVGQNSPKKPGGPSSVPDASKKNEDEWISSFAGNDDPVTFLKTVLSRSAWANTMFSIGLIPPFVFFTLAKGEIMKHIIGCFCTGPIIWKCLIYILISPIASGWVEGKVAEMKKDHFIKDLLKE